MIIPHHIEQKYAALAAIYAAQEADVSLLRKAFELAAEALDGKLRESGDPFVFHATAVAHILASEVGLGVQAAIAALLHEVDSVRPLPQADLQRNFGKEVALLVLNLGKISQLDLKIVVDGLKKNSSDADNSKTAIAQAENFRKLMVSYSTNPQMIVIKLADRLEVMRSLAFFSKDKQSKKATETLRLFAPLAHKLGLYKLKSELEDLSLRYKETAMYRHISTKLKMSEGARCKLTDDFIAPIKSELQNKGYTFDLKYRTKSIYSIWNKMQKQGVPFESVYDVFAIRIVLDMPFADRAAEVAACWDVYSVITSRYEADLKRMRDWVTTPKDNGYESLHATVKGPEEQDVEVQIRTRRMDDEAEHGLAAHWRYKGVQQDRGGTESWLANMRRQLETSGLDSDYDIAVTSSDEVFVFTPKGELRMLKKGATVLDFAFDIHSNIGCRCTGALRNGKHVSIREQLQTGDVVDIITSKNQTPNLSWLEFVCTSKAKNKVRQKLREDEAKVASNGRETLERKLKNWKFNITIDTVASLLSKHFKIKTISEIYVKLALEELDFALVRDVLQRHLAGEAQLVEREATAKKVEPQKASAKRSASTDYIIIDDQLNNVAYKLGKCCNPIFGDDMFGFVTVGSGVTIHRTSCPNAERLMQQYPYRVLHAKWRQQDDADSFQAVLKISANNEVGMQQKLSEVVDKYAAGGAVRSFQLEANRGQLEGQMRVFIKNVKQLETLLYHLRSTKGVIKAARVGQ
ncbi:MAG: RelA/SpoT family protein [Prevotellaceae bacterium]|jgi:GTP pyrophosphokinase|nr:RelA/SpoT family protein [Prevotellaceae bacterium]